MTHRSVLRSPLVPALLALSSAAVFVACGDSAELETSAATSSSATSGVGGGSGGSGSGGDASSGTGGGAPSACDAYFADVPADFPDAGTLGPCDASDAAKRIAASLMNLDGLSIDNNGVSLTPCVAVRCDGSYAYVASNALPHYDFVQTTPNALVESPRVYRIPLVPKAIAPQAAADDVEGISGCQAAYTQYLGDSSQGTQNEPGGYCKATQNQNDYLVEQGPDGPTYLRKIACLGTTAFVVAGSPIYGPNEAGIPDPYGNPLFFMPDTAADPYLPANLGMAAALDLCGGHTANSMHYHGIADACFERDGAGKPARSGAESMTMWDFEAALDGPCTAESGIVGWALDGVPIKGSCVCVARAEDGSCSDVRRVRSSYVYAGLGAWGSSPNEGSALGNEGKACTADADCCSGATCDYQCTWAVFDDAANPYGTTADKRCVLMDYSWCTSDYKDRSAVDTSAASFVYLDRCNGFEGPDGYSYHATASFPMLPSCYRYEPEAFADAPGGGGQGGGGGGMLPECQPGQTMMCCGDGVCDGPETSQNCAADCP
jgi:hypothetical protein